MKLSTVTVVTAIGIALICNGRTLEEAQASYTDGTKVLSTREEGKGKTLKYVDVVQLPNGEVTIKVVHTPETIRQRKDSRVIPWLSGKGTLVSATTNKNSVVETWKDEKGKTHTRRRLGVTNKSPKSKLLSASTNEVKVINFLDYKKTDVIKYVVTTNENPVVNDDSIPSNLLSRTRSRLLKKNSKLLGAGTNNVDEVAVTNAARRIRLRMNYRHEAYTGGYYLMDDGNYITYRDALNFGFAGNPTNEWMQAVFDEVTSDPYSLWTRRQYFDNYPLEVKENKHYIKASVKAPKHAN